jgi:ATP-dependent protease ClpP protease subunit
MSLADRLREELFERRYLDAREALDYGLIDEIATPG